MKKTILAMTLTAAAFAAAPAAFGQQGMAGTNGYTAAQRATAEAAVRAAGYTPTSVVSAQGGAIFIRGDKEGKPYILTVTGDGKVYPSAGATTPMPAMAWPAGAGRGGRGGGGGGGN